MQFPFSNRYTLLARHRLPHRILDVVDAPWKGINEARRLIGLPFIRIQFAVLGIGWRPDFRIYGKPIIQRFRGSEIILGSAIELRSFASSNPLAPNHPVVLATRAPGARISIGNNCGLTGGAIVAARSVSIGDRVLIGANSVICDTDFHPLSPEQRSLDINSGACAPVVIEDDVFVGMNVLILKGSTISTGSVIGAGSVITGDVPPFAIVAGNPARVLRYLVGHEPPGLGNTSTESH